MPSSIPDVPAAALLSFVKQASSDESWDAKRLASILHIKPADVPQIAATLEMLGYAEPVSGKKGKWRNTAAGNSVSGAKPPRFNRKSVTEALDQLKDRAGQINADRDAPYRITELVAFGDFLDDRPKTQAADVGIGLAPKHSGDAEPSTAVEHKREEHVLSDLKAKSAMLNVHPLEDWMRKRQHRDVLTEPRR